MRFELEISLDNAAFVYDVNPDAPEEGRDVALPAVAESVQDVARRLGRGESHGIVLDENGNRVGQFQVVGYHTLI